MGTWLRVALLCGLAPLSMGCTANIPLSITDPNPPAATVSNGAVTSTTISNTPFTQFSVLFGGVYLPGSFQANLDGQDVTGQFSPTPTPNGRSSAPVGAFLPQLSLNPTPQPPYQPHSYQLTASAQCIASASPCGLATQSVTFIPPQTTMNTTVGTNFLISAPVYMKSGSSMTVNVAVQFPPPQPIAVTIVEYLDPNVNGGQPILSLNNQPVGTSITVTIPSNSNQTTFTIGSTVPGKLTLYAEAPGCIETVLSGTVLR
jgi:hypothetical protein